MLEDNQQPQITVEVVSPFLLKDRFHLLISLWPFKIWVLKTIWSWPNEPGLLALVVPFLKNPHPFFFLKCFHPFYQGSSPSQRDTLPGTNISLTKPLLSPLISFSNGRLCDLFLEKNAFFVLKTNSIHVTLEIPAKPGGWRMKQIAFWWIYGSGLLKSQ